MAKREDLREKLPPNIVKGAHLENTANEIHRSFSEGEEKNAELINNFFNQPYFRGEESLIDKLTEADSNIKFDDIEEEGINLAILQYNNWRWDLRECLNKIKNDNVKNAFIEEIHAKVQTQLGTIPIYGDFDNPGKCRTTPGDTNVLGYFQKVVDYLQDKEGSGGAKKTLDILTNINITNKDLNDRLLATGSGIPLGVNLSDPSIPANLKNAFDILLSFEIGKEADRTINICKDIQKNFYSLQTNTFPAINTIIGEHDEYKYDENKLGDEYKNKVKAINNNTSLSKKKKKKQIRDLKRKYYLKYLKSKNLKIGNALQQLYENNFDYDKIDRNILKEYIDAIANIRFKMLVDEGLLNEGFKINFGDLDDFESFYKDLADIDKTTIDLKNVNTIGTIQIPVQKKITQGPNEWLKDIDEFGKNAEKSYDTLPIEYVINKDDFDREVLQKVTMEDKEKLLRFLSKFDLGDRYEIKGENIGSLIFLYFVINNKNPLIEMDPEKQKEVEKLFGKAKNGEHAPGENSEENEEENNEDTAEKFKEKIEGMGPGKFENGSEIWLPMGESELPGGGYQWMKIKISNVDMEKGTFKGTIFGGELKFNSKLEGKSKEFKMNEHFLNDLNEISKDSNKIYLQPNPDNSDFNSFKDKLGGKLGNDELNFPPAGITWTDNKFMQKIIDESGKEKDVEIKYFGAASDDKSTYKIEYNPIRKSFTVSSSFNGDEKGKDGKSEKKRFSYKRNMDWNNFLIFFSQKGLVPQTEEESQSALQRQNQEFKAVNGGKWKLNWFSINNIRNGFKDIFSALKKKLDEYDKNQTEKFKGIVEGPILNALSALRLPPSLKYAIGERQQEIYNEELNGAWKEIEKYLKALQSDGQFADTFDQVPAHVQTIYGKSYQKFIIDLFNKKGDSTKEESRKAAALLLANFEKGGSPFRGLAEYENKGLWVKVLLGEAHHQQFKRDKAACERARDIAEASGSEDDKKGLNEQLATCEWDYIINQVRGSYPKLPDSYFPCHEKRGIDGDNKTNYIPNPSKKLLSDTFANKLEDAKKGRFTKSSVEETYTKNKSINRFAVMEDEFSKCGSARYKQGAAALRRMLDLASNETLKKRAHKHFLTFLLSGILDVNCDPGLKKQIYGWAKPISFVPGMLVKEAGVAENVAILLDAATEGDFSKNIRKYFHKNKQHNGAIDFKGLQGEINTRLTNKTMDKLNNYFSKLPTNDLSDIKDPHKKQILEKFKKSLLDEDVEEFDRGLLDNPTIVNNGLLTNINVVSDRLKFEDGEFKGKDSDDISNKRKFRNDVATAVNNRNYNDPKDVNFVLDKYFSRFGLRSSENRQNAFKWVNTAYHYQKMVNENGGTYQCTHQWGQGTGEKFDFPLGTITQKDVDKVLLYAFEGKVWERLGGAILPEELKKALDAFQNFFSKAFKEGSLKHKDVKNKSFKSGNLGDDDQFLLGGWDAYKKIREKELPNSNDIDDSENVADYKSLKPSQRKEITRRIFTDDDNSYVNPEMESIYKTLKRRNSLDEKRKLSILSEKQAKIVNLQKKLNSPKKIAA